MISAQTVLKFFKNYPINILFILSVACSSAERFSKFSLTQIHSFSKELNLPEKDSYVLDSSYFPYLLSLQDSVDSTTVKNHYQPLQAIYFNQKGELVSYHVNCYAGLGVGDKSPLNWNQNNAFETFIPKTVAPIDSIFGFSDLAKYIVRFDQRPLDSDDFSDSEYKIVVFWTMGCLGNEARNLINLVQENARTANAKIIYVNCDNMIR